MKNAFTNKNDNACNACHVLICVWDLWQTKAALSFVALETANEWETEPQCSVLVYTTVIDSIVK
jgi:hypothetical protein